MTQTTDTLTSTTARTANHAKTGLGRGTAPRRWWRALDRMTLDTMNPPIPEHVRAAMSNKGIHSTPMSDFAAAIRAGAPGRIERSVRADNPAETDFALVIRAAAPGRRVDR